MTFSVPPQSHEEPVSPPPPYGYTPIAVMPVAGGAAITSLILGIVSHIPGLLFTTIAVSLYRRYGSSVVSRVSNGFEILSAIVAIVAIVCGHVAISQLRASYSTKRAGAVMAGAGLALGYSVLAEIIFSNVFRNVFDRLFI